MKVRIAGAFVLAAFGIAACGGSGGSGPPGSRASIVLTVAANGGSPTVSQAVVLYDGQFLDPFANVAVVQAAIVPAQSAPITWMSSNANVVLSQQEPNFASPAPSAPPQSIFASTGSTYGAATITAAAGPPVNQSASIAAYHYPSLALGCTFRYSPAYSFDPGAAANGAASDLYATMGSDQLHALDPCANTAFATAPGSPQLWHTPYGGTFVAGATLSQFPALQTSAWQDAGTVFSVQSGALLFKTKGGAIVKALVPVGPYEVSTASGQFPF